MSTPDRYMPSRGGVIDARLVRDVLAVMLLLAGALAIIYAGFLVNDAVGWAAFGVLAIAAGFALGFDRSPSR